MIVGVAMCLSHFCGIVCSWGLCVVEAGTSSCSSCYFIFILGGCPYVGQIGLWSEDFCYLCIYGMWGFLERIG